MEFNTGDRVRVKSKEYLQNHRSIDGCTCVPIMHKFAGMECTIKKCYTSKIAPRYSLNNKEYPDIEMWSWVPQWLEPIKTIDIQADALQDLLQM